MNLSEQFELILNRHDLGGKLEGFEIIQDLWSGYGVLVRINSDTGAFVIKQIKFPESVSHPKGHHSAFAHERKKHSYQVEMNFYANYQMHRDLAYTPRYVAHQNSLNDNYLILEDLKTQGYLSLSSINKDQIISCLKWLAGFHIQYLNHDPTNLWTTGCYWHLETRPQEFETMQDGPLKKYAELVNKKLNDAKFQTILHGDAKLANFLFKTDRVSAVDFQYCGRGSGVKDLAYFLSSIYSDEELFNHESEVLDVYFNELRKLGASHELVSEWKSLYPYAWFDFYRFLAGWAPDHYKINDYIKSQMNRVLHEIE